MIKKEVVQLAVQLDTRAFSSGISQAKAQLNGLASTLADVGASTSNVFSFDTTSLDTILTNIGSIAVNLDTVTEKIVEIAALLAPQEGNLFDAIAQGTGAFVSGVDAFNSLADARVNLEGISEAIAKGLDFVGSDKNKDKAKFSIVKALFPDSMDASKTIYSKLTQALSNVSWESIKNIIPNFWENIASKFSGDGSVLGGNMLKILTPVMEVFGKIGTLVSGMSSGWLLAIGAVIASIILLIQNWDTVVEVAQRVWTTVQGKLAQFDDFLQYMFSIDYSEHFGALGHVMNAFLANVKNVWEALKAFFSGLVNFVKNVFVGDWKKAWDGIVEMVSSIWDGIVAVIKWKINRAIGFANALIQGIADGINAIIRLINGINFEIPNWAIFGDFAGKKFTPDIEMVTPIRIPYLAQGAVLPANKPFLAVVGDQKHGTNVEAPLATIQEAVALVMQDQFSGMMAGFEASVGVQKQILQAVLGIEIGDSTIGQAAARYNRKMAVIQGGM